MHFITVCSLPADSRLYCILSDMDLSTANTVGAPTVLYGPFHSKHSGCTHRQSSMDLSTANTVGAPTDSHLWTFPQQTQRVHPQTVIYGPFHSKHSGCTHRQSSMDLSTANTVGAASHLWTFPQQRLLSVCSNSHLWTFPQQRLLSGCTHRQSSMDLSTAKTSQWVHPQTVIYGPFHSKDFSVGAPTDSHLWTFPQQRLLSGCTHRQSSMDLSTAKTSQWVHPQTVIYGPFHSRLLSGCTHSHLWTFPQQRLLSGCTHRQSSKPATAPVMVCRMHTVCILFSA